MEERENLGLRRLAKKFIAGVRAVNKEAAYFTALTWISRLHPPLYQREESNL